MTSTTYQQPDVHGYYGRFGGAYIPEMLHRNVEELKLNYLDIMHDPVFQTEFRDLLQDYVGRPTPLYFAKRLSEQYQARIFFKTRGSVPYRCTQNKQHNRPDIVGSEAWQKKDHCRNRCRSAWRGNCNRVCIKRAGMHCVHGRKRY